MNTPNTELQRLQALEFVSTEAGDNPETWVIFRVCPVCAAQPPYLPGEVSDHSIDCWLANRIAELQAPPAERYTGGHGEPSRG